MLYLVGAGLWDEKDISLRGMEILRKADKIYLDSYTSVWKGKEKLEAGLGKTILIAGRSALEEDSGKILKEAEKHKIVILVPGDPMVATTHSSLILEARQKGISVEIIHSSSIISAVAETGLHIYKFGKIASIPFSSSSFSPESFYDSIKQNKESGLHTLLLLDIKDGKQMEPKQALEKLLEIEKKRKQGALAMEEKIIIASFKGKSEIKSGKIRDLMNHTFTEPCCIIIPGKLHRTEEDFLS